MERHFENRRAIWSLPALFQNVQVFPVNSFGCEYKPGRPVNKETRKRIIDLYLVGEGPSAISRSVRVTKGAVWKIIRHNETLVHMMPLVRGTQREYSSKPLKYSIVKRILVFKDVRAKIFQH